MARSCRWLSRTERENADRRVRKQSNPLYNLSLKFVFLFICIVWRLRVDVLTKWQAQVRFDWKRTSSSLLFLLTLFILLIRKFSLSDGISRRKYKRRNAFLYSSVRFRYGDEFLDERLSKTAATPDGHCSQTRWQTTKTVQATKIGRLLCRSSWTKDGTCTRTNRSSTTSTRTTTTGRTGTSTHVRTTSSTNTDTCCFAEDRESVTEND